MENLSGKTLGAYVIVSPLGEGGMAAVYKAYQASMERYVALKILPRHLAQDPEFVNRFQQEAKVLARLQHPHILPIHDYGQSDGYTYIVMPLIEHGVLTQLLGREMLPLHEVARIITQVGEALDYAHSHGVIHRDVKPSNILLDERGNCLLTDFGIAKMMAGSTALTQTGAILGTPAYMSPEQGIGESFDARSDIYALGVILYEMVTGRVPYKAETPIAIILKHVRDPLPAPRTLNPHLPVALEQVILKVLAKDPQERYATAREFAQAVVAASRGDEDKTLMNASGATIKSMGLSTAKVGATEPKVESGVAYQRLALAIVGLIFLCCFIGIVQVGLSNKQEDVLINVVPSLTVTTPDEPEISPTLSPTPLPPPPTVTELPPTPTLTPMPPTMTVAPSPTATLDASQESEPTALPPTAVPTIDPRQKPQRRGFAENVLTFGSEGRDPGQLDDARYIGVDQAGQIYVGEYGSQRIQVFSPQGQFVTQWLVQVKLPLLDMVVSPNGEVYAVQNSTIYRYNGATGELLGQINPPDGGSFEHITAVPSGGIMATWYDMPPGNFVGTLYHNNIIHLDMNGQALKTWPDVVIKQTDSVELDLQLAAEKSGGFYVLRGGFEAEVLRFSAEGEFLYKFGEYGLDVIDFHPGEFASPRAIAVDAQGRVYVAEFVPRIQVFDDTGQFIDVIKSGGDDMVFDEQGALYVVKRTVVKKFVIN